MQKESLLFVIYFIRVGAKIYSCILVFSNNTVNQAIDYKIHCVSKLHRYNTSTRFRTRHNRLRSFDARVQNPLLLCEHLGRIFVIPFSFFDASSRAFIRLFIPTQLLPSNYCVNRCIELFHMRAY